VCVCVRVRVRVRVRACACACVCVCACARGRMRACNILGTKTELKCFAELKYRQLSVFFVGP